MSISIDSKWLTEHRGWEDILSACAGVLAIFELWQDDQRKLEK